MIPPPADIIADERPFSRRALAWVVGICGVSFAVGALLSIFGTDLDRPRTDGGDAFSRSALGHEAFVDLLDRLGIPVAVSRHASARRAAEGLLVLAEPGEVERVPDLIAQVPAVLVILPKWQGLTDPRSRGWIVGAELLPAARPEALLKALAANARVVRPGGGGTSWQDPDGLAPDLAPVQLVTGEGLTPLVSCAEGALLAEVTVAGDAADTRVVVCADPDLFATHGFLRGDNVIVAVRAILDLRPPHGTVVFDETLHGHALAPSIWRALLRPPLAFATAHLCVLAAVLAWLALGRFGAPVPPPPAIAPGKGYLIENTAALQRMGGHTAHALRAYLTAAQREVAARFHVPEGLPPAERRARLAALGTARGVTVGLEALDTGVHEAEAVRARDPRLLAAAQAIHRWRREMLHGA